MHPPRLQAVLHAPTASALERARNNASNILGRAPETEVRIIANAQAVMAAIESEPHEQDARTYLCPITLKKNNCKCPERFNQADGPAALWLLELQQKGWFYIRA
ncbi:MAG: hypothetical protein KIG95_02250 [Comamonas sp.]|uniref:hypothetical protein n=1 Tax=Comamonas testosteroni TaxID=285 RepID=UPI0000E75027|nr:hypothetical protein [Comamonas testosteroni]MBS7348986.1 hypothetical protein [Comamonas sp.]WQG69360.1 hypothetical protein SR914_13460 [Comamonas testosteroni]